MGYKLNHSEKEVAGSINVMLTTMEAVGQIVHHDRLNSGSTFNKNAKTGKTYAYRMCRPGTPDHYVILNNGTVLWIEAKSTTGKQSPQQAEFERKINGIPGHHYMIARSVIEVIDYIDSVKHSDRGQE